MASFGKALVVRKKSPRKLLVTFKPPHAGTFHAALKITFSDKTRSNGQEFTVERELRGRAILLNGPVSGGEPSEGEEDMIGSEGARIMVSHDYDLEFLVERSRPDESFGQQIKELIITKPSVRPSVFFKAARVYSPDNSVARCVHIMIWLSLLVSHFLNA